MDLSFSLIPRGRPRLSGWSVSLADIRAAADAHRFGGASDKAGAILRGQDEAPDTVHVLACNIMPSESGLIDTASLGGSFNPLVAHQLMVGKIR